MSTRIKFCGLTRVEDVDAAVALGVDAIGLVFDPASRRSVDLPLARSLRDRVPVFMSVVALLRDAGPGQVAAVIAAVQPDLLQFHGDESPEFCERWSRPYLKAIPMAARQDLEAWCRRYPTARGLLLDSHAPGELGGTGRAFDWSQAPRGLSKSWVLAGGLNPGNVAGAVTMAAPPAVDVSSGIESAPGLKDATRMRDFVAAVRHADAINSCP